MGDDTASAAAAADAPPIAEKDPVFALIAELARIDNEAQNKSSAALPEDLVRRANEVTDQIRNTKPVTFAGAIAMLELGHECGCCDERLTNTAIAGLRELARRLEAAIDTAPVRLGEEFGPCLLRVPRVSNYSQQTPWLIGCWDGNAWADLEGPIVHPTHWAPLPLPQTPQ